MGRPARAAAAISHLFFHPHARVLADRWHDHFCLQERMAPPVEYVGYYLWAVDDHLELRLGPGANGPRSGVWIPLSDLQRRAAQGGEVVRACGLSRNFRPRVLDAMAGWGVDGLVLAARGCQVTLVERHPAVSAMQQDLARRSGLPGVMSLHGDGFDALQDTSGYDVVYLDPMFPERSKGTLPGKRMQFLAALTEPDPRSMSAWLEAGIAAARVRVVLKRRRKDPELVRPDWRILGRTVRYDVYRGALAEAP